MTRPPQEYLRTASPEEAARLAAIDAELAFLVAQRRKLTRRLVKRWDATAKKFADALGREAGRAAAKVAYPISRSLEARHG